MRVPGKWGLRSHVQDLGCVPRFCLLSLLYSPLALPRSHAEDLRDLQLGRRCAACHPASFRECLSVCLNRRLIFGLCAAFLRAVVRRAAAESY